MSDLNLAEEAGCSAVDDPSVRRVRSRVRVQPCREIVQAKNHMRKRSVKGIIEFLDLLLDGNDFRGKHVCGFLCEHMHLALADIFPRKETTAVQVRLFDG